MNHVPTMPPSSTETADTVEPKDGSTWDADVPVLVAKLGDAQALSPCAPQAANPEQGPVGV